MTHNARWETVLSPKTKKAPTCTLIHAGLAHDSLATRSDAIQRLEKSTIAARYASFFPNRRIKKTSLLTHFHAPTIGGDLFKRLLVSLGLLHLQSGPLQNRREERRGRLKTLLNGDTTWHAARNHEKPACTSKVFTRRVM